MTDKITKFIESLDSKLKKKIQERLIQLKTHPFKMSDIKKLKGWGNHVYRLRIGEIRIIYRILGDNDIEIVDIDFRGNIY